MLCDCNIIGATRFEPPNWDLVVCDKAHKLSATVFGGEIKYTKRYRLGELLSTLTRHFLLMTATTHNGKEAEALIGRKDRNKLIVEGEVFEL